MPNPAFFLPRLLVFSDEFLLTLRFRDSEESSNKKMRPCPEFYRKRLVDPRNNSEIPMENDPYSGVVLEYEEEEAATMQEAYDKRWGKDCKPTHVGLWLKALELRYG